MNPLQFFAASRLVIVAGKGGVGKTTVTAVLARAAADLGLRVLVIDVEGKGELAPMLAGPGSDGFGYEPRMLFESSTGSGGSIEGRLVSAGEALRDYLVTHGFGRLTGRLALGGVLDVVSTAAPGIDDILVLGKIKQIEQTGGYDLILLDAPAAGHAISFLQAAAGLRDAVRAGPIHTQAGEVLELLADPARCQVILVTLPEPTPVNELVETSYALEDRVGVALGPVVVNGLYPVRTLAGSLTGDAGAAAEFRRTRCAAQLAQVVALEDRLALPQLHLPFVFTAGLTADDIADLAVAMVVEIERLA